ncbi:MAG: hypothetical protein WCF28_00510 [Methanobacterium sp.]|uniref:hypothetical protein n=1 Tax=Methanobacterium sp. TaxID=2164 RepID=UPI003C751647
MRKVICLTSKNHARTNLENIRKIQSNLIAQCLMIEYLLDPELQKRVKNRIKDGFKRE